MDLIICASYRKNSTSQLLAQKLYANAEVVRLADLEIAYCRGCGGCDKSGKCVIKDDHAELLAKIDAADRVILAFPLYFDGVPAQLKTVIDRMQQRYIVSYGAGGRIPKTKTLDIVFTAGGKAALPESRTLKYFADCIGATLGTATGLSYTDTDPSLDTAESFPL